MVLAASSEALDVNLRMRQARNPYTRFCGVPPCSLSFSPGACSLASHITIEETGAPYEAKLTAIAKGEQHTPEYLAINPRARVPALKTDDGVHH
jgi:hypothetical protein